MIDLVQTISSVLIGAASLIYLVENGPVTFNRLRFAFYSKRIKQMQQRMKQMKESAEMKADLLWADLGKPRIEAYLDGLADAEDDARAPYMNEARQTFCFYAVNTMLREDQNALRRLEAKALPRGHVAQMDERLKIMAHTVDHAKDHLADWGFDLQQLETAIAAS